MTLCNLLSGSAIREVVRVFSLSNLLQHIVRCIFFVVEERREYKEYEW